MKILIATKDEKLRLALTFLFTQETEAHIAGSVGDSAGLLALVPTSQPDVVLLDRRLPGQAIANVIRALRALEAAPKILLFNAAPGQVNGVDTCIAEGDPPETLLAAFRALPDGPGGEMVGQRTNNE